VVHTAWDGTRFLVAWTEGSLRTKGVLLDARGTPLVSKLLVENQQTADFSLAAGNGGFMIFDSFPDFTGTPTANGFPSSVRGFRIDDSAGVVGPIPIAAATTPVFSPRAAFDGRDYVVVWSANEGTPGQSRGARVASDDSVIPIAPFYSGGDTVNTSTWTGAEYLVTLSDGQHVDAIRLDGNGLAATPVKTIFAASTSGNTSSSGAAWNGRALFVAIDTAANVDAKFLDRGATPIDPSPAGVRIELIDPNQSGEPIALSPGIRKLRRRPRQVRTRRSSSGQKQ
jgi:hypothetical protein